MNLKGKNKNGSVLIFTLFVMVITFVIGISMLTVSLSGRRSTLASGKSVNAFQIADSGLEAVLIQIKNSTTPITDTIEADISDNMGSSASCDNSDSSDNFIIETDISGGEYKVRFFDGPDPGDAQLECGDTIDQIKRVKSIGTYRNTSRSVETTLQ